AGVRDGDLVLRIGKQAVSVHHDEELPQFMAVVSDLPLAQETEFTISRGGKEKPVRITPTEREELRPRQQELKQWGITARNLSGQIARELKRPNRDGVLVTSVRPGGPAGESKPHVEPQDVIVQINDSQEKSLSELTERSEGTRLNSSHVAISYAVFCLK